MCGLAFMERVLVEESSSVLNELPSAFKLNASIVNIQCSLATYNTPPELFSFLANACERLPYLPQR